MFIHSNIGLTKFVSFLFYFVIKIIPFLFVLVFFCFSVGLAQGGVHMLANDFDKRPIKRDKFDLLMQERDRRNKKKADAEK